MLVGGGVVLAASYEAKAFGVKTAMGGRQAKALCPTAVVVRPRFDAYVEASRAVFRVFEDASPLVEALSIDEAFLDVRGLERSAGTALELATRLRHDVREQVGLPITVGVARTKFLAKVASGVAKPDGLLVVPADRELEFLHPLSIERLWGVGPATARKLQACGLRRVGDVADVDVDTLVAVLGRAAGHRLHALAHNRDPRPVRRRARRRSIGSQRAVGRGEWRPEEIDRWLVGLVDRVMGRVRSSKRVGRTVVLRLRFGDFTRATRSATLSVPTAETAVVLVAARRLLREAWPLIADRKLTLLGITITNLRDDRPLQLSLEIDGRASGALDEAVDAVRNRFGRSALTRAVLVGLDDELARPILDDELSIPIHDDELTMPIHDDELVADAGPV